MHIVKKRKKRNVIKQNIQKFIFITLTFAGLLYFLNLGIDYISHVQWFVPKKIVFTNNGEGKIGSAAKAVEFVPIEKLADVLVGEDGVVMSSPTASPIEEKIRKVFPEDYEIMLAIAKAESSMNPEAVHVNTNGTIDCGLLQINSVHGYECEWLKDPDNNLKAGREVYEKQGLTAWTTYQNIARSNKSN